MSSNKQIKKKNSQSKGILKQSKPPLTKEFYWDYEIDKIHDICKDEGTSGIFQLTSNNLNDANSHSDNYLKHLHNNFSETRQSNRTIKSINSHASNEPSGSLFNKPK